MQSLDILVNGNRTRGRNTQGSRAVLSQKGGHEGGTKHRPK